MEGAKFCSKTRKKGVSCQRQFQEVLVVLYRHFVKEKEAGHFIGDLQDPFGRLDALLSVSKNTVKDALMKDEKGIPFETPNKSRKKKKPVTDVDDFTKDVIARTIYRFHAQGKKTTLNTLLADLKESGEYSGSRASLHRIITQMDFRFKKIDNRIVVMERPEIVSKRLVFLREYMLLKRGPNPPTFVFLDETWLFLHGVASKTWTQPGNFLAVPKRPTGEGKRFIVLHAGTNLGFVPGADLLFSSRANTADYHGEMNGENFMKWITTQLIPGLEEMEAGPYVIVMDNASYHSEMVERNPTCGWRKDELKDWLTKKGVAVPEGALKNELVQLAKMNRSIMKEYKVDRVLEKHGHKVLRLPPYHCQYNPIELVWAETKHYYNSHINDSSQYAELTKNEKTLAVWRDALSKITPDSWEKKVKHAEQLIEEAWNKELAYDREPIQPIVINLNEDSSSDDDSDIELGTDILHDTSSTASASTSSTSTFSPVNPNISSSFSPSVFSTPTRPTSKIKKRKHPD